MKERQSSKRRRFIWGIIAVLVLAGLGGWGYQALRPKLPLVSAMTVHTQDLKNVIFASGTVKPDTRQVILSSELPGPVAKLDVSVGDKVHVGQTLLQCQNQAQLSDLKAAEQQQTGARQAYNAIAARIKSATSTIGNLNSGTANSVQGQVTQAIQTQLDATLQTQLQSAQVALNQAEAAVQKAQLAYAATTLKATISGTVVTANTDGILPDGTTGPVIEVAGNGKQVVSSLSEVDAVNVRKGMSVSVSSQAFPGKTWQAKVTQVTPFATSTNSGAGQVQVLMGHLPSNWPVPLGYQVDLHIVSQIHHHVPVVPYSALVQHGTDYVVFVVNGNRVRQVTVTLGITSNSVVEVATGLHAGEKIVKNPPANLKNGEHVRVG